MTKGKITLGAVICAGLFMLGVVAAQQGRPTASSLTALDYI